MQSSRLIVFGCASPCLRRFSCLKTRSSLRLCASKRGSRRGSQVPKHDKARTRLSSCGATDHSFSSLSVSSHGGDQVLTKMHVLNLWRYNRSRIDPRVTIGWSANSQRCLMHVAWICQTQGPPMGPDTGNHRITSLKRANRTLRAYRSTYLVLRVHFASRRSRGDLPYCHLLINP